MTRTVFIRADANREIGWGHVVRTSALAEGLVSRGFAVTYFVRKSDAAAISFLEKKFNVVRLRRELVHHGKAQGPDRSGSWLILDQYGWTASGQAALRSVGWKLLCVDDFAGGRLEGDIILNPSLQHARYRVGKGTKLLLGSSYALLRREFRAKPPRRRREPLHARKILVTFGGGDRHGLGPRLGQVVGRSVPRAHVRLVAGLSASVPRVDSRVTVVRGASAAQMRRMMEWCDLAISSASSTVWELSYLGVPTAVMECAGNQRPLLRELRRRSLALDLGRHDKVDDLALGNRLRALAVDRARRESLGRNGTKAVDGLGVSRIIRAMEL